MSAGFETQAAHSAQQAMTPGFWAYAQHAVQALETQDYRWHVFGFTGRCSLCNQGSGVSTGTTRTQGIDMTELIRAGIRPRPDSVLGQFFAPKVEGLMADLPWPPAELSPNRKNGKHWSSTHDIKTRYLSDCRYAVLLAMRAAGYVPPKGTLALTITFCAPDKRRRDMDNLLASLKSGLDGVSQALGVDDQYFEPITLKRAMGGKPGKVVIEVMA